MRRVLLLCAATIVAGCAKTETPPPADSAAATAPTPAPKPITLADVTGKWDVRVLRQTDDSLMVTQVFDANADSTKWTMTFPNRKPVPVRLVSVEGDSIRITAGPFDSAVRKGAKVKKTETTYRIQDGKLVGRTVVAYATARGDSVVVMRMEGTRAP